MTSFTIGSCETVTVYESEKRSTSNPSIGSGGSKSVIEPNVDFELDVKVFIDSGKCVLHPKDEENRRYYMLHTKQFMHVDEMIWNIFLIKAYCIVSLLLNNLEMYACNLAKSKYFCSNYGIQLTLLLECVIQITRYTCMIHLIHFSNLN